MIFDGDQRSMGGTTMIPLTRLASYNGIPVSNFLSEEIEKVAA
jgi:malate dehydrogenase